MSDLLPPFHKERALALCANDAELFHRVAEAVILQIETISSKLELLKSKGPSKELRIAFHSMVGSASNVAADVAEERCRLCEHRILAGEMPNATEYAGALSALEELRAALVAELSE